MHTKKKIHNFIFTILTTTIILGMISPLTLNAETSDQITEEVEEQVSLTTDEIFHVEEIEEEISEIYTPEVQKPAMFNVAPISAYPVGKIGTLIGSNGRTYKLSNTAGGAETRAYVTHNSAYTGVVGVLEETPTHVRIAVAGVIGWIPRTYEGKSIIDIYEFTDANLTNGTILSYNHYKLNDEGELIHRISPNSKDTTYSTNIYGKAPSYLVKDKTYISFDGHYFYDATPGGMARLQDDYRKANRSGSLNKDNAFYNYFQWLPARSQSLLTAADMKNFLTDKGKVNLSAAVSGLHQTEQMFFDMGQYYGGNHAIGFAMGIHESAFGKSGFSLARNNFFGHSAYDSSPGAATTYASPAVAIEVHFARMWNWNYLDGTTNNWLYQGGSVGDKSSGMNVVYASDPYWGEKIASHYYKMDKMAGQKDYNRYTLGLVQPNVPALKTAGGAEVYKYGRTNSPIILLDSVDVGGVKYYKTYSEHLLDEKSDLLQWIQKDTPRLYNKYTTDKSFVYIKADQIKVVSTGRDSKAIAQANTSRPSRPSFADKSETVTTTDNVNLRIDNSTKYDSIISIPKGTVLTGLRTTDGWFQVVYDLNSKTSYIGYVHSDYITGGAKVFHKYDLNKDDKIDIRDMMAIRMYILNPSKRTAEQAINYDLHVDKNIDIRDMMVIRRHILGL